MPAQVPHGPAETQARAFSTGMGALAGAATGATLGLIASFFIQSRGVLRSIAWTTLGAIGGFCISNLPWVSGTRTPNTPPLTTPLTDIPPTLPPGGHAARLEAARQLAVTEPSAPTLH